MTKKLLADFNAKVEMAKTDVVSAQTAFNNISSIQDGDKFFREGHQYLKKVHDYLKEVRLIARKIIQELRL